MGKKGRFTSFVYVDERLENGDIKKRNTILFADDEVYGLEDNDFGIAACVETPVKTYYIDDDDYRNYLRIQR